MKGWQSKRNYRLRKIDKYISWSLEVKGYIKYKEIVELHNEYNIKIN